MSTTHTVSPSVAPSVEPTLASQKGEIRKCHACNNANLPLPKRVQCRFCLTNGYVATCLPCKGTGMVTAIAVWDGKSQHGSTCNTCGGLACLPARLSEFEVQEASAPKQDKSAPEEAVVS